MFKYLKKRWKESLFLVILKLSIASFMVSANYIIGLLLNYALSFDLKNVLYYGIIDICLYMLFAGAYCYDIYYSNKLYQLLHTDIRDDITWRLSRLSYSNFIKHNSGKYVAWLSSDMNIVEKDGFSTLFGGIFAIASSVMAFVGLYFIHWLLCLFVVVMIALSILFPMLSNKKIQRASKNYSEAYEDFIAKSTNILQGFDVLFSFNRQDKIHKEIHEASAAVGSKYKYLGAVRAQTVLLSIISNILSQYGVLFVGLYLGFTKMISYGMIVSIEAMSSVIFNNVSNFNFYVVSFNSARAVLNKIDEELSELENENLLMNAEVRSITDETKLVPLLSDIESIEAENLSFSYGERNVFQNLNFRFKRYGKYALIGKSGAGKTTIFNLISKKLLNYGGSLKINSMEASYLSGHDIRKQLLYVDQTPYIFNTSIRENITLGEELPDFSDDKIWALLEKLDLKTYVENLSDGLNSILKENGKNLSGGQKQRIALARGLIRNKNIIMLDESTSNQDKETARYIENMLLEDENITLLMITHHLREEILPKVEVVHIGSEIVSAV